MKTVRTIYPERWWMVSMRTIVLFGAVTWILTVSSASWADEFYTSEEIELLKQLASFYRSAKNNVLPGSWDAIRLDRFSQKGSPDIAPAVRFHLMSSALGVLNDKRDAVPWQVAKAEGRPELFDTWLNEVLKELPKHQFPFDVRNLSKLRPQSDDFVTNLQMNEQLKLQFGGMFITLGNKKLQLLREGLQARAVARKLSQVDPASNHALHCEVVAESGGNFYATMNRLTNRGSTELKNMLVIQWLEVEAPEVKIHPNYRALSGLNNAVGGITGIGNAQSQNDQGAINQVYQQWNDSFDYRVLNFIPRLKPRESVLLPISSTSRLQYAKRLQAFVCCDDFWIDSLPVVKLADYQKQQVQKEVKRGATWLNGDKPHVVADEVFEKNFLKARTEAAKSKATGPSKSAGETKPSKSR